MHRRVFLQTGMEAMLAMAAAQVGTAQPPAAGSFKKLKVDAYSRHLQWLRTADQVAEAVVEMGFDGVDVTVRPYPGHVDPEKVAQDLPPFVNTIRKHGLQVVTITCPITDADSPHAEEILQTASSLGITHYWWGTFRYEQGKPVMPQLEALKPRVAKLAALNAKYKMTAMYHTYSGSGTVGAAIWDLLHVLKDFDPKQVGFHYDTGHMTNAGGNGTWALNMRAAGSYIAGISAKDSQFEPAMVASGGGPLTPDMAAAVAASSGRRGGASPGAGGPGGRVAGGGQGASGANPVGRGAPGTQAADAGGARGNRGGGPQGGRGGRGGGTPGWRIRQVPLGTGMIDLSQVATILKEIGFSGPIEIQAEYPNGGAESAQDKITLPREMVLGAMKRDLLALKMSFGPSGLL
jgi:sugar phosphate isomerase/epimerase